MPAPVFADLTHRAGCLAQTEFIVMGNPPSWGNACRTRGSRFLALLLVSSCGGVAAPAVSTIDPAQLPPAATRPIDFARDIQPIFQTHCVSCHGVEKQRSGLRLDDMVAGLKGGENHAPDIRPGNSAESPLIHFVAGLVPDLRMPLKKDPLSREQIGLLRGWIDQGAKWPEGAAQEVHWSLKPVVKPASPVADWAGSTDLQPVDAFVAARLTQEKLAPSAPADPRTLIRRLYFDLIGLPPTPEEVRAFEQDQSPTPTTQLVERLLASPRYGERWARHWLDVVRFAETTASKSTRRGRTPGRIAITSFAPSTTTSPTTSSSWNNSPAMCWAQDAATGFLVAGPDDLVKSPDPVLTSNQRADELHDIVSTTSSAFLGSDRRLRPLSQSQVRSDPADGLLRDQGRLRRRAPWRAADEDGRCRSSARRNWPQRRQRLAEIDAQAGGLRTPGPHECQRHQRTARRRSIRAKTSNASRR